MSEKDVRLDWRSRHDPRSRSYGVAAALPASPVVPTRSYWPPGIVLDQGAEGACVGHAWAGELAASPFRVAGIDNQFAYRLYKKAQTLDPWEGEEYSGTSVLAGAKACQQAGLIGEYRWAFSLDDLKAAVLTMGPAVIGIPWYSSMYNTRPSGLVDVGGKIVGGHAILIVGYDPAKRLWRESWTKTFPVWTVRNSWGADYGVRGDAYILESDLAVLLADTGEACVPMRRALKGATS